VLRHVAPVALALAATVSVAGIATSSAAVAARPGAHVALVAPRSAKASDPSMSSDGRFVAFQARRHHTTQVLLWDGRRQRSVLVSATHGVAGDGVSDQPSISPDGRYVAYVSTATNLAGGAVSGQGARVLLWDRRTGATRAITAPDATAHGYLDPRVSSGAAFVLYTSMSPTSPGGIFPAEENAFVWSKAQGNSQALPTPGMDVVQPWGISDDGRYLIEEELSASQGGGTMIVDRVTGLAQPLPTYGAAWISGDGRSVAYEDPRLEGGTVVNHAAVWDRSTRSGAALAIPHRFAKDADLGSFVRAISTTGRFVAVTVPSRSDDRSALLLVDRRRGKVTLVSRTDADAVAVDRSGSVVSYLDGHGAPRIWRRHA
jgi:hypothetical protein